MTWTGQAAAVVDQPNFKKWSIVSDNDADTTVTITHGFVIPGTSTGVQPLKVWFTKTILNATTDFRLSSVSSSSIVLAKNSDASSSPVAFDVYAERPHSITQ